MHEHEHGMARRSRRRSVGLETGRVSCVERVPSQADLAPVSLMIVFAPSIQQTAY